MIKKLLNFYRQTLGPEDKIISSLLLIALAIGTTYILINTFNTQYSGNQFVNWHFFIGIPLMVFLYSLALFAKKISPRMGLVTWTYTVYFFMLLGLGTLVYGTQFTPFHPTDGLFIKIDQLLGFNQTAVLDWIYAHPALAHFLDQMYSLIGIELSLIPLIVALLFDKRAIKVLLISIIFSFIAGTTIYYFFPTTAPASMFFDPNFIQQQHDTFIKFFEIHHHLPITTQEGGLIAFPSFHVVWSVLLVYAFRSKKFIFYPIAVLNTLVIASTVCLGWHYLVDVFGGLALGIAMICLSEAIYKKYISEHDAGITSKTTIKNIVSKVRQLPTSNTDISGAAVSEGLPQRRHTSSRA